MNKNFSQLNITPIKLSPSDLTFLFDDCKRCFYEKVKNNNPRPSTPFPKMFNTIDNLMKLHYEGKSTKEISRELEEGHVHFGDKWVESKVFRCKETGISCFFRGRTDTVVKFEKKGFGIVDFKTSYIKEENIEFYSRQLHAYSLALENAKEGFPSLKPISELGLLVCEPKFMTQPNIEEFSFNGPIKYQKIVRDDKKFFSFLRTVLALLGNPIPPEPKSDCKVCKLRIN